MKKKYIAPELEIEIYALDKAVASNCNIVVSNGPEMGNHPLCEDYAAQDPFGGISTIALYNVQFYTDTNCDCYYSTGEGYWMS